MFLKFIIRNLLKRPFLNFVKILGLSLSLSGVLLIVLFLKNELTYDLFNKNHDRIYRFTTTYQHYEDRHFAKVPYAEYIPDMAAYFPGIETYVRLVPVGGGIMKFKDQVFKLKEAFECDSTFFKVFTAKLIAGNPKTVLDNPGSMVISESYAKKIFGNHDPIGKVLTLPSGQYYAKNTDFTIRGIMKDFPQNSHFHPQFITTAIDKSTFNGWALTYFLLKPNADPNSILSGFQDFCKAHNGIRPREVITEPYLSNIANIHLHSHKLAEIEPNSNMSVIYTLSVAALILLLIAFTNYAGLNIGMAYFSDKYLFVSKVSGSSFWMDLKYLLTEATIISLAALVIGGIMATLADLAIQKYYVINLFKGNLLLTSMIVVAFGVLTLIVGVFPIFRQAIGSLKPAVNYRNNVSVRRKGISKGLIVLQYTISIALIVAVFVIRRQINYGLENSMGENADNLICFENVHFDVQKKFEVFKAELLKYGAIQSVSAMNYPPGGEARDRVFFDMEGYVKDEKLEGNNMIGLFPCDYSFANTFKLQFLSGRNFSKTNDDHEGSGEYIVNEAAMRKLHYTDPQKIIGKWFRFNVNFSGITIPSGKIIGVVKNFHLSSMKNTVNPLVLFKSKAVWLRNFVVRFQPGMKTEALTEVKKTWTKMFPEYPFQYKYVGAMYENVYKTERLQVKLLSIFTFMALFICSIGLLGLSLLTTQRRTKEIGIRKVNGAKSGETMMLLNLDFIKWIFVSLLLAIPLAYFAMSKWLENYAYKITISWWIFVVAGLIAVVISFLTVSINSSKAANRNPVESLRYE